MYTYYYVRMLLICRYNVHYFFTKNCRYSKYDLKMHSPIHAKRQNIRKLIKNCTRVTISVHNNIIIITAYTTAVS